MKTLTKIGFVPFTRKCAFDQKVRCELGQVNANEDLENLQVTYSEVVAMAEKVGINPGIFDSKIPVPQCSNRAIDEDEQVRRLVAEMGPSLQAHCGRINADQGSATLAWHFEHSVNKLQSMRRKLRG